MPQRLLHQHRIEKLLVVDDDFHCIGLITVKDIEKAQKYPNACKDEQRPPARGGGDQRRRGWLRARRTADRGRASIWSWSTPRTAIPSRVLEAVTRIKKQSNQRAGDRRQRRHGRRHQGADRCRRRRGQGRHWPGLDLHHAHRGGRGHAAAHRHHGMRWRRPRSRTCPSSPTAASSSRATSSRRWPPAPTA